MFFDETWETLIRDSAGSFAEHLYKLGKDWTHFYRDGIESIHWQTMSKWGTPLGGACEIEEATEGGRLLAAYVRSRQKNHDTQVARHRR